MKGTRAAIGVLVVVVGAATAWGNGGPFVVKYPSGDPAAKGILARLDPSLRPARETRLRVVKEDLTIVFRPGPYPFGADKATPPLADVTAAYTIANPTEDEVQVDFGFPILRGIYTSPLSMVPRPAVTVTVDGKRAETTIISNSVIYGIIRQQARQVIERGIAADADLADVVAAVRRARGVPVDTTADRQPQKQVQSRQTAKPNAAEPAARAALRAYLTGKLGWNDRDAALMVEYAGLDFGKRRSHAFDRIYVWDRRMMEEAGELLTANLGPLAAIGEQKATQLFACLASRFDADATAGYEAIFRAWGGDVRQRSIDVESGKIRPREYTLADGEKPADVRARIFMGGDPTIYARVDYLDEGAKISDAEKAACRAVLKNLPVVFTFAPMNLLHYRVSFPPGSERSVVVKYQQYPYEDTRGTGSYQLAYVLHPATLWDDFGPIRLSVTLPEGVRCATSVPLHRSDNPQAAAVPPAVRLHAAAARPVAASAGPEAKYATYVATLNRRSEKSGELLVALDKSDWNDPSSRRPVSAPTSAAHVPEEAKAPSEATGAAARGPAGPASAGSGRAGLYVASAAALLLCAGGLVLFVRRAHNARPARSQLS